MKNATTWYWSTNKSSSLHRQNSSLKGHLPLLHIENLAQGRIILRENERVLFLYKIFILHIHINTALLFIKRGESGYQVCLLH